MSKPSKAAVRLPQDDDHPDVKREDYEKRLRDLQLQLRTISLAYHQRGLKGIVVMEGSDAAGKGGAIRRMTAELDPRHYRVWPIGPPSAEELRHHYLWRFWQRMPERGSLGIFDRSWYGRVLVERVDALAEEPVWKRAYDEINTFEKLHLDEGTRVVKVYLHVSKSEQRRRLTERVQDKHKNWKISAADFRSHQKTEMYAEAANEMFERTSTPLAPWHVIAANHKRYARLKVLEAVIDALGGGVDLSPLPLAPEIELLAETFVDGNT